MCVCVSVCVLVCVLVCVCVCVCVALIVLLNGTFGAGDSLCVYGDSPAVTDRAFFFICTRESILP